MSIIVGLNAYHADAAACIVVDGRLIAAAEEERFRRIKHWAGFPSRAIQYCLQEAGCSLEDVAHLAINTDPRANLLKKVGFAVRKRPELGLVLDRIRNARERTSVADELSIAFPGSRFGGELHGIEHHLAHLASAYHASPHRSATVVSVDGFGDFASAAWGRGAGAALDVEERVYFPHSLGIFYQALTQYLGFPNYGDEYKVMGLAPYGEPRFLESMRRLVRVQPDGGFELELRYFRHHRERIEHAWSDGAPRVGTLYSDALEELLGPARSSLEPLESRHHDIARSVQAMYEEALFALLERLHAAHGERALCLSGGCAMNSVANGKIRLRTPFEQVYVQPAAGDAGGAVGAALVVAHRVERAVASDQMPHAYWGPSFGPEQIDAALSLRAADVEACGCRVTEYADDDTLCAEVAADLAAGAVVGWFQGRMEWGPRALGNRSILGDPRRADMKELLNRKIKRRESFRPFAPSVLEEAVPDWFEQADAVPFMMQVYQVREERRAAIPAVTHVDGSGRLQSVSRDHNLPYRRLIERFAALTSVPMLLNTSFNENEPVVCRPAEALDCFLRTGMDVLVLGRHALRRG